ncbi:MAG: carboxypeptidase regulatory-like domain-containing protein [Terracidiphilus sp.]
MADLLGLEKLDSLKSVALSSDAGLSKLVPALEGAKGLGAWKGRGFRMYGLKPVHFTRRVRRQPLQPTAFDLSEAMHARLSGVLAACTLVLSLAIVAGASAQTTARPATHAESLFRIAGTVVNAATGEPVHRASVAVLSEEDSHTVAAVESDGEGHFSIDRLPAAKYQLTASKRGFRTAFYDEHDEFNSAIVTGPGQDTDELTFQLVPGGTIHGVVLTDGGDPVESARVMLFVRSRDGKPGMRVNQAETTTTDDTGAYEFSDLAAGDYLLAVSAEPWYAMHPSSKRGRQASFSVDGAEDPAASLDVAYPVTYFDSTTDEASASPLVVNGGARVEADINLHATPAIRIQVDAPRKQDGAIARAELRQTVFGTVISAESTGFLGDRESGPTEFTGVAPGHYELAQGEPSRVIELDATANVQVDPTLGTATVPVRGSLRTAGGVPLADECNLTLEALSTDRHQDPLQSVCIRGAFSFPSVPQGEWQLSAESGGRQLPVASITTDGHVRRGNRITVVDKPLSVAVTVTAGTTRIEGFARKSGKGVAGVMVVLVPSDLDAIDSLARRDQSDSDGSFSLRDVAPGTYKLVAIEDAWQLDWADQHVIGRYLPGGISVTVSDRSSKTMTLDAAVPVQGR